MDEKLAEKLKYLRLAELIINWDRYLKIGTEGNFSHTRLLKYIIEQEYDLKKENARKTRIKRSGIPELLAMETFPFQEQPKLNKKKILSLYDSFDYMTKIQNVIWIGPTGAGKTGLATAFLLKAINNGYTAKFISFPEIIRMFCQCSADQSTPVLINKLAAYDCLLIDELGYVEVEAEQVGQFFTLMNKRHKTKTTLITSNLGFSNWPTFLKNNHLSAALIDRLTENSHVFNMKNCASLRHKL
ncbi:MAG: ATP-binding protein [Candidatus Brocadiales bacterium]|nr:ATP-binding protein [Candidatus Brocadiales bacterium]